MKIEEEAKKWKKRNNREMKMKMKIMKNISISENGMKIIIMKIKKEKKIIESVIIIIIMSK